VVREETTVADFTVDVWHFYDFILLTVSDVMCECVMRYNTIR
jgi:hypothetical protein